ncbi:hypothetical protein [Pyxidicoccus sp. MSG2]|uniref:hypothetical protein n=1 Tax=Pyxidicoccus sp. MSG2 TaxID=2996790 RepID=UPI00226F657A|nr:hypothetical protein [Pyxidicoccus sp. MSG2]MCY1020822.1 hypothetical protein [Pyxidicoccus sp. MSG2]
MEKPREPARHFTQQEAELILRRAAHLGTREARAELSLEELERIAADAGISPESVRRAAESLEAPATLATKSLFFGESLSVSLERALSVQLTPKSLEKLASLMDDLMGGKGTVFHDEQRLTWTRKEEDGSLPEKVTLWSNGGRLRVELRASQGALAGGLYGGVWGGVGGGLGIPVGTLTAIFTSSVFTGLGVFLGIAAGGYALARVLFTSAARNRRARWEHQMRTLCEHITGLGT